MNTTNHRRRSLLKAVAAIGLTTTGIAFAQDKKMVQVWKDPNCGCCKDWIAHMESNGFKALVHETGNTTARARLGMPQKFASCHTALVGGYVLEGHVPASEVQRLLKEGPQAVGLAVPGMPVGSPGMDGPAYGGQRDPFDVLLVLKDGSSKVFKRYT
ncbi:MAG: DUF411 domain-containing protein [Burkholderiales bacterium]|nr:DUF411 domain-containing protein [Burkholderiales bacterium]